jgi:hypothetical protein
MPNVVHTHALADAAVPFGRGTGTGMQTLPTMGRFRHALPLLIDTEIDVHKLGTTDWLAEKRPER